MRREQDTVMYFLMMLEATVKFNGVKHQVRTFTEEQER